MKTIRSIRRFNPAVSLENRSTVLERRELLSTMTGIPTLIPNVAVQNVHTEATKGKLFNVNAGLVYVPKSFNPSVAAPLLVAYSPSGNPRSPLSTLEPVADAFGWILYSSSYFKDNVPKDTSLAVSQIEAVANQFPVDRSRIILSGLSGGGSFSHWINFTEPGFAAAIIINTAHLEDFGLSTEDPSTVGSRFAASRKIAIFLDSPTDFRYHDEIRDQALYQSIGWQTIRITFKGGHRLAPTGVYLQAARSLTAQNAWRN